MHFTIFKTPIISTLVRWISILCLKLIGWRVDSTAQVPAKCVLIGAPHTSNWDFPIALMICFALRRCLLDGKKYFVSTVLGIIMRWLGGIPVDRSQREFSARNHPMPLLEQNVYW